MTVNVCRACGNDFLARTHRTKRCPACAAVAAPLDGTRRDWNARLKAEGLAVVTPSSNSIANPDRYLASQKVVGRSGTRKNNRNRGRGGG